RPARAVQRDRRPIAHRPQPGRDHPGGDAGPARARTRRGLLPLHHRHCDGGGRRPSHRRRRRAHHPAIPAARRCAERPGRRPPPEQPDPGLLPAAGPGHRRLGPLVHRLCPLRCPRPAPRLHSGPGWCRLLRLPAPGRCRALPGDTAAARRTAGRRLAASRGQSRAVPHRSLRIGGRLRPMAPGTPSAIVAVGGTRMSPAATSAPQPPPPHPSGARPPSIPPELVPRHVAIGMDGNGRWANARGLTRNQGHAAGEAVLLALAAGAIELGTSHISAHDFPTENWTRSPSEARYLTRFNRAELRRSRHEVTAWGGRVGWAGRRPRLWRSVIKELEEAERLTAANSTCTLTMCVNYGGRAEITDAVRAIG